jgi:hypothetical protein
MEKGICPNCQKAVEIQEDAQVETCLNCQKNYLTSQAKKLFGLLYSQHASNGNIALNTSMNYTKALIEYEKLLALDKDSLDAIFGISSAKICLAKLEDDAVPEIIDFIGSKFENLSQNSELNGEIARYLLVLGSRFDGYIERSKNALMTNRQYIDEGAKKRFLEIIVSGISLWGFINSQLAIIETSEEGVFARDKLSNLREMKKQFSLLQTITSGSGKYDEIRSHEVFENRVALFKVRIGFMIAQFVFVVGAIVGFSIMMTNYATNPIPGLIVFGAFAVLFVIANIGGRILKSKLSK